MCKQITNARVCVHECVTYSVCEHFHPNKLLFWSLHAKMVKTQIYKPGAHTHTQLVMNVCCKLISCIAR